MSIQRSWGEEVSRALVEDISIEAATSTVARGTTVRRRNMSDKRESSQAARQRERQLKKQQDSQNQARSRPTEVGPRGTERMPKELPQATLAFDEQHQDSVPSWLREGRRHGYPDCCILFFHRFWGPLALATTGIASKVYRGESCTDDELSLYRTYLEHRKHLGGTGYVPCPGCLAVRLGGPEMLPSLLSQEGCPFCEDLVDEDDDSAEDGQPGD